MSEIRLSIAGCTGRMGRAILSALAADPGDLVLAGAGARAGHESIGQPAESLACGIAGPAITGDPESLFEDADVVVDFSSPSAAMLHAQLAAETKTALLVGTTGLDAGATSALEAASRSAPVLIAPNTSLGVNLMLALVAEVAQRLGEDFEIAVHDLHHAAKKDAPSGTALALARAAAEASGVSPDAITITSVREGDAAGEHTVTFAAPLERLTLTHVAEDRAIFARGALRAARWLAGQPPGLYSMADVLALPKASRKGAV